MMMEQASRSGTVRTLVTLPVEILAYIISFLSTRDKMRTRWISKTLRSVSEIPSLWENFDWSHYAPRDDKLLEHVLQMFGKHVKRIHFSIVNIVPSKLHVMLKFCKNLLHLSMPSCQYGNLEEMEKILHGMNHLRILDIKVPVFAKDDFSRRKHFTLSNNLKELSLHLDDWDNIKKTQQWLLEWANNNYVPRKLNLVIDRRKIGNISFICSCVPILRGKLLQKTSDLKHMALVNIYVKTSTEFSAAIPYIQLRVNDSSVFLSSVKASKYGILGLRNDTLHLTEGCYRGKKVYKALLSSAGRNYLGTSITSLSFVTHFDASHDHVSLYPGHLEQLSIACPNLQMLNLSDNWHCLSNLEGLQSLADNCKSLRGLSLKQVHLHDDKYDSIQLWEILCTMRLTELAIEPCMLKISDDVDAKSVATSEGDCSVSLKRQKLICLFQRYSSLQVLEVGVKGTYFGACYQFASDNELSLITNFPAITSYRLCSLPSNDYHHTLSKVFGSKYLKCLLLSKHEMISGTLALSLEGCCPSLQQVYIDSKDTVLTELFIDALCGHGGLEHVIFNVKSLTAKSIENIIKHSSNLVTFCVFLYPFYFPRRELITEIKTRFHKRRLFNGGNFYIKDNCYYVYYSSSVDLGESPNHSSVWDSLTL